METNSEKELFSLLEPVEACLNDYDKARLWTRIKKDALRMRALRRTAIIAGTLAAAMITGVVIFSQERSKTLNFNTFQALCRKPAATSG